MHHERVAEGGCPCSGTKLGPRSDLKGTKARSIRGRSSCYLFGLQGFAEGSSCLPGDSAPKGIFHHNVFIVCYWLQTRERASRWQPLCSGICKAAVRISSGRWGVLRSRPPRFRGMAIANDDSVFGGILLAWTPISYSQIHELTDNRYLSSVEAP